MYLDVYKAKVNIFFWKRFISLLGSSESLLSNKYQPLRQTHQITLFCKFLCCKWFQKFLNFFNVIYSTSIILFYWKRGTYMQCAAALIHTHTKYVKHSRERFWMEMLECKIDEDFVAPSGEYCYGVRTRNIYSKKLL